jgi:phasin family protein
MASASNIHPNMNEGLNFFKQFKFPGAYMETLVAMQQLNTGLLNETQQIAMETTKSVMDLEQQFMKNAFDQWNEEVKYNISKAPLEEKTTHQAEVAKDAVSQISEHANKLSSILTQSNEKFNETLQKHIKMGMEESSNLSKRSSKGE